MRQREEIEVHLRGEAFGDVGRGQPSSEGMERFGVRDPAVRADPILEADLFFMDGVAACVSFLLG